MGKHRWRKQKSTDRRQQARFAIELTIYAVLFPLLFVVISLIYPIAKQLIGVATEDLEPLNVHVGIAFTMNIHVFSYSIIASYLLFLDPDTLPKMVRSWLGGRKTGSSKTQASRLPDKVQEPSQI